jgi:hypothetical protein
LAMAAEESESGNQYETSEAELASSASELEDSEIETPSAYGKTVREDSICSRPSDDGSDSEESRGSEDRTLDLSSTVTNSILPK